MLVTISAGSSLDSSSGPNLARLAASSPYSFPSPGLSLNILIILKLSFCFVFRFVFIPLFLFCNIRPAERGLTFVAFESDVAYIIIMLLFSLSNGYIGSICMISGPQVVRGEEAQTAAGIMVAILGLGLGTGAFISNFMVKLI